MDTRTNAICPYASSTTCFQIDTTDPYFLAMGCRRYDCDICGPRKRAALARRIVTGNPNRLITLTCRHEITPAVQYDRMRKLLQRFTAKTRNEYGEFEYVKVLEECKDGYPHFHILARSEFIPQPWIKANWYDLTGADIVDVRKAHGKSVSYIAKYIGKAFGTNHQLAIPTRQRLAFTRSFLPAEQNAEQIYACFEHSDQHPTTYAQEQYTTTLTLHRLRPTVYAIADREPGDELPPELLPTKVPQDDLMERN